MLSLWQHILLGKIDWNFFLQVGMKWIMREGYRSRKQRLSTIPGNDEEIKKVFDQINDGDVAVPKQVLMELVKKSTIR